MNQYQPTGDDVETATERLLRQVYVLPAIAVMPSIYEFAEAVAREVLREAGDG